MRTSKVMAKRQESSFFVATKEGRAVDSFLWFV